MRALITGATGFIGSKLAERAASMGHRVVAFGAENTPIERARRQALEARDITVRMGSLSDTDLLRDLARDCDTVFHLAAAQHETNVPDAHFHEVNVQGTRNLLEACAAVDAPRFVHGSTIGIYGSAADGVLDENSPPRPENIYESTKLEAEKVVQSFAAVLPITIIRISETYGPGDGRLMKFFKLLDKGFFPMIGASTNEHHLVHVEDLVDGLLLAASRDEAVGEVFVLAGAEVLATQRMAEVAAEALGKRLRAPRVPLWPLLLAAISMEKTLQPLGISPPLSRRRLDFYTKRFYFRQDKAKRLLGYEPKRRFKEGAAETAAWYRERGYL